ncbi:MAG TPA: FKBP-type peptidyl-prolyl cis-trans isomerase [Cytophagaceae bacterium]
MKVEKNKVVTITYELRTADEKGNKSLVEKVEIENPMVILFGASGLPDKFETELEGLSVGESFEFQLESDEAYGDFDSEAVVRLPLDVFKINGEFDAENFHVGMFVPMSDEEGNMLQGKILEITNSDIQMDFNHPLAGKDLYFIGKIEGVRDASPEELDHGHVHGPGGHHH